MEPAEEVGRRQERSEAAVVVVVVVVVVETRRMLHGWRAFLYRWCRLGGTPLPASRGRRREAKTLYRPQSTFNTLTCNVDMHMYEMAVHEEMNEYEILSS